MARPAEPEDRSGRAVGDRAPTAAEARAAVEARREQRRAERSATFAERYGDSTPGRVVIASSWAATAVFAVVSCLALVDSAAVPLAAAVSIAMFLVGCAVFALVLVLAAARSREDLMGIGGLFFLAGSAPARAQWHLLGSLSTQVVVAVLAASLRPFTEMAFGTLAPTLGLALCGLWTVRHGVFPSRRQ